LPGTKAGGPVRSIYSLTELMKNDFDIHIITTNFDLGSEVQYSDIKTNTWFKKNEVNYFYFSKSNLTCDKVIEQINKIAPQLVYINSIWSYNFSIGIVKAKNKGQITAPVLLAPRGMLSRGAMSLKFTKKKIYLVLARLFNSYQNIAFHATNESEKSDILKQFAKAKILVAPNLNSGVAILSEKTKEPKQLKLFYLSRIARVKNLHFALEVLSQIPKDIQIEYDIFGNNEDKIYWQECETLIQKLPSNIKANYKGELSFEEVQSVISNYHALLLPTLNENFGHSIVESLLSSCLVIISNQTPWNDVEKAGVGFAIDLNNREKFIEAIVQTALLNNVEFNIKSKAAINYISSKLNTKQNIEQYNNLFNGAIKN